ncbi:protein PET100 homolog, mitochondrial [Diorhabda carinulata]|uniref:protein PET100 homolog, mitochondrial n=1 Tax=Diorhabda sublineata TaxID=1163346 RepID=UPI0024E0B247|nr:protein PET100 homolog, mitochondrial [Diorhabda sublineata]XP_057672463.1 protein PET100 homolog, mitochondrial [Diorhabda carinulata]
MGTWTLEVAKMALYVTFPVALFHYFNQPQYFEEWVVNTKRELFPPETEATKKFQATLEEIKRKQNLISAEQMESVNK